MGDIEKVHCNVCGADWQCRTGCGIFSANLKAISDIYSYGIRKKIDAYAEQNPHPVFEFGYRLACCYHCSSVISTPVLKLKEEGTYIGSCPKCGENIVVVEELGETACPMCGMAQLESCVEGIWD